MKPVSSASRPVSPAQARVRANELASAFAGLADRIRVLSLDCFDTILWRQTATPIDVFYDLQESEPFRRLGYNAKLRVTSESTAREMKYIRTQRSEVTLPEIYRSAFPALTDTQVAELAAAELAAEIRTCHPFPPVIELIRAARRRGLKIVIVSDTYLDESQLRHLLSATLPEDAYRAIDRVFCSSAYGHSKVQGLHLRMLERMKLRPNTVLHVGDNEAADFDAAVRYGLHAFHLVHHAPWLGENLRLQGTATSLLVPSVRQNQSLPQPFRAMLAMQRHDDKPAPVDVLGYAGAGPLLYAFGRFILDEIQALRTAGHQVKPVFLMRDGHLPQRVAEAIAGGPVGQAIAVSRFAAYAASFRSESDVEKYLAKSTGSGRFELMGQQLLLTPEEASSLAKRAQQSKNPTEEFVRLVRDPETMRTILDRSRGYCSRFFRYLNSVCGLERGDTLLFIDLGYEGTAQRQLEGVFRNEWGITIRGCYLLAARIAGWEQTRRGLFDPSWCDDRALGALVGYIALIEDLCTSDDGSVIGYSEDGTPEKGPHLIAAEQYQRVKPVQARCVEFARDAEAFFTSVGRHPSPESLRLGALGALGRLLFFPNTHEVTYLNGFQLDLNLASRDAYALFNCEEGLSGLRRRGLFFMEQGRQSLRMNYPIELRAAGIELSLALLSQLRYGLEFSASDMSLRHEPIKVLTARGTETSIQVAVAQATHDGFFSLVVPVGMRDIHVGLMFGHRYSWVQVESIQLIQRDALFGNRESEFSDDHLTVHLEGMAVRGPGLFECTVESGFLFVTPKPKPADSTPYVCRVVFRPLSLRDT